MNFKKLGVLTAALLVVLNGCAPAASGVLSLSPLPVPERREDPRPSGKPVTLSVVPAESEVRYRIREQLVTLPLPNEVVGITKEATGTVALAGDGGIDLERSKIVIDLRNLKTDRIQRDRYVQREVLNTAQFQTATFAPREVKGITGGLPTSGEFLIEVTGDFTVKDQTKVVLWQGTARFEDKGVMVNLKLPTSFAEMGLTKPSVAILLSVEDDFQLEADLKLVKVVDAGSSVDGRPIPQDPRQSLPGY